MPSRWMMSEHFLRWLSRMVLSPGFKQGCKSLVYGICLNGSGATPIRSGRVALKLIRLSAMPLLSVFLFLSNLR